MAVGLVLAGCGQAPSGRGLSLFGRDDTYKFPTEVRDAESDRRQPPPPLESIDKARWKEMNAFALRSTQTVVKGAEGNVAFCPVGLWSAGAVLLNASNGEANEAAATFLGLKDPQLDAVNGAQQAWHASVPENGPLRQGLGVFMIWPVLVTHEFADSMARDYRADVLKIGSAGQGATNAINSWASRRTGGAVDGAVNGLSRQTVFEILHVAAFKDKWRQKFDKDFDFDGDFALEGGGSSRSRFMRKTGPVVPVEDDRWKGCAIPFVDDRYVLVAAMPKAGTVDSTLSGSTSLPPLGSGERKVRLVFPQFKIRSQTDLLPVLRQLGGGKLLVPPNDFRRMSIELDEQAYVGRAFQTVTAEASEEGFEATSVTEINVPASAEPEIETLRFDRPFFWGLVDTKTGVYLFTGVVRDPSRAN